MDDDIDVARGNVLVRKASAIQGPARTLSVEIVPGDNGGRRGSSGEKKLATKILNAERNDANKRYTRQLIPYSRVRDAFIMVGCSPKSGISRKLNPALEGLHFEFSNFGQKNGLSRPRLSA